MLKHPIQTEARIRLALERIQKMIYFSTEPLEISIWNVGGEPVPFAKALKAEYTPFKVGGTWGSLWDTAWFRFSGKIPKAWSGSEVVSLVRLTDVGREGFTAEGLVYQDGLPVRAINANRREVRISPSAKGGESFEFFVEAAANGGTSEAGVALGINLPEYNGEPRYRLEQAEFTCKNQEAFDFYYDFKVALEAMESSPPESQRRGELRYALNQSVNLLKVEDLNTVAHARGALQNVLEKHNGDTAHQLSAIGHAHIDTAWLWPLRETIRKCARTFSTALDYMDSYPEYIFACSQAQQYAWMKAYYPQILDRIKKAIRRGQWEPVGSMWIEADCNLVSGESLVRQILHGKRFFKEELGYETEDLWIPDVFGYAASLPQIMQKSGIKYFLTQKISWSQFNKFPHQTFFWEGIDGTRIFTHFPPAEDYNADTGPKDLTKNVNNFREHDRATRSLLLYGWGDGGGGPSIEMLEKARRLRDFAGLPKLTQEKALDFFAKAEVDAHDLPVWVGELYLELHRGTYTTQAKNKLGNRRSEFLLREAEFFDAITLVLFPHRAEDVIDPERAVYDVSVRTENVSTTHRFALDRAWKLVLLNQFHDIIPGSSIHWVYQDSTRDYETVRLLGESVRDSALGTLVSQIDTRDFSNPIFVSNTLGFARREIVDLPDGQLVEVTVPACGYIVIENATKSMGPVTNPVRVEDGKEGIVMENGLIRITIGTDGHLASIYDLLTQREILSRPANLFYLHEDIPNCWDAWDVEIFHHEKYEVLSALDSIEILETGPLRASVRIVRSFGKSRLEQNVVLRANSGRIDFPSEVNWQESQKFLRVAFPVAIRAMTATYEIQYGHVERPTHFNTSWDLARFEVCAQKWADLSEPGYGVALLNDCKYGYDIHDGVLRLSLLRSPLSPDPLADRGTHRFTYALLPHSGSDRKQHVIEEAYALNAPLMIRSLASHPGTLPPSNSFFVIEPSNAIIEAIKVAEGGGEIIVRVYESEGSRGPVSLITTLPMRKAWRTDLLENSIVDLPLKDGTVTFNLDPFEIATFKFAS